MDALALIRSAGNIAAKMAAIGMNNQNYKLRITNYEFFESPMKEDSEHFLPS